MKQTSTTQYIILAIFIISTLAGVIVFATLGNGGGGGGAGISVTMWGTVPKNIIGKVVETLNAPKPGTISIEYTEKNPETFDTELTEALAEGSGPDIVLLPHSYLVHDQKKLVLIPWNYISERTFKDTFIEGGEIFLTDKGALAVPFIVDPLVMYWNRDMFNSVSIAKPPVSWTEVTNIAEKLTQSQENKTIKKSAISFGEFQNVSNAKSIISLLTLQAGGSLVKREGEVISNTLLEVDENMQIPAFESAVSFFTQFADPLRSLYSWNRSLPLSQNHFTAGNLAMYFGFASELNSLRSKNPNLNFDVAIVPQAQGAKTKITYGNVYGLGIVSNSKNQSEAFSAIAMLASLPAIRTFVENSNLPPVRRDLLTAMPGTSSGDVFWKSALWTRGWLDPDYQRTSIIFRTMIESITSGETKPSEATRIASQSFDELVRSVNN